MAKHMFLLKKDFEHLKKIIVGCYKSPLINDPDFVEFYDN